MKEDDGLPKLRMKTHDRCGYRRQTADHVINGKELSTLKEMYDNLTSYRTRTPGSNREDPVCRITGMEANRLRLFHNKEFMQ